MMCYKIFFLFFALLHGSSLLSLYNKLNFADDLIDLCGSSTQILIYPRYATSDNITSKPLRGYSFDKCLLSFRAAQALYKVEKKLNKNGYSLVVYDAARPFRASDDVWQWLQQDDQKEAKKKFYPLIDKKSLLHMGRCLGSLDHEKGYSVDVTLIKRDSLLHPPDASERKLEDGSSITFFDDGSIDMGSSYGFFDPVSYYDNPFIQEEHMLPRCYLKQIMAQYGFKNDNQAWWHFTLEDH